MTIMDQHDWRSAGLRYHAYQHFLKQRFGSKIKKVSVDAGFTCPNVDGTVAIGGCSFCDNRSFSPSRRLPRTNIREQIDEGIRRIQRRFDVERFLAYFQPATNTYAPLDRLKTVYDQALEHPQVVGLAIGTRGDCVADDVLDLLQGYAERTYLSVEYGVQTIHDRSLDWMNRGHHNDASIDALERSRGRGFEICVHLILGLPGESRDDMLASVRAMAALDVDAVKLHNLYAVQKTPLADQVLSGEVRLMERDEYVSVLVDALELLNPRCVVERVHGEAPPNYLVGPAWCLDKPGLRQAIDAEFARRDTSQGRLWKPA